MKTCRFCAEEIQDAAIVCKHCGRDLAVVLPKAKRPIGRAVLVVIVLIVALIGASFVSMYFSDNHQRFIQWSEQRDRWHVKCDRYVGKPLMSDDAKACNAEFQAMTAFAKEQGWSEVR